MKVGNISVYVPKVSQILEDSDKSGAEMGKFFEPLKTAIEKDDLSSVDLAKTKEVFKEGTDDYKQNLKKFENLAVPVKLIGKHKSMTANYRHYVDACEKMLDTIDVPAKKVDVKQFNEAEKEQDEYIQKVMHWVQKIMI